MPAKVKEQREVKVETVDVARLVTQGGNTFFVTFNRTDKTCGVSIGSSPHRSLDDGPQLTVSFASIRAFAKLLNKHAKES